MKLSDPLEIIVAGVAGQGSVLAGRLLAEAAVRSRRFASQTAKTAVAVRTGCSEAHVVISKAPVDFPYAEYPEVLLVLHPPMLDAYEKSVRDGGFLLIAAEEREENQNLPGNKTRIWIPTQRIAAAENLPPGNENLILAGSLCGLCPVLSVESIVESARLMPVGSADVEKALLAGAGFALTI